MVGEAEPWRQAADHERQADATKTALYMGFREPPLRLVLPFWSLQAITEGKKRVSNLLQQPQTHLGLL